MILAEPFTIEATNSAPRTSGDDPLNDFQNAIND